MRSFSSRRVLIDHEIRPATVRCDQGRIVSIDDGSADVDFGEHVILPGLVDSHVHVNEPGRTEWEGFATATASALAGGTTTIVDMPLNSIPPTTSVGALNLKRAAASGQLSCDVAFWGGIVPGSQDDAEPLIEAGVCGFKVFLTDSGVPEYPPVAIELLDDLSLDVPLLVHAEWPSLLAEPGPSYESYLLSRPPGAEAAAIERLHDVPGPVHVLHVSSAEGVAAIAAGAPAMSGETCPHYLTFTDADVSGTEFKCAPPIRSAEHREALWEGLADGVLDLVVSDHSPSPPEMKEGDFATAWGGIASVQLRLQVTWTGASERGFDVATVTRWLASGPAALAGLDDRKGSITLGKDADFVVFDPEGLTVVDGAALLHRHPLTPYHGMRLRGEVMATILGGVDVYDGARVAGRSGKMLVRS